VADGPTPQAKRRSGLFRPAQCRPGAGRRAAPRGRPSAPRCSQPICAASPLSEATEPAAIIVTLHAWFERVAGAVHAFGGEVLKFIGDGVLRRRCARSSPRVPAWPISMRSGGRRGCRRCPSARRCISARCCGAISVPPTGWISAAIGPAVNLVSRLEGLCRPLGRSVLIPGAVAAETTTPLCR